MTAIEENIDVNSRIQSILQRLKTLPAEAEDMKLPEFKKDVAEVYFKLCKAFDLTPSSALLSNLNQDNVDFSFHGLGPHGAIALTKALTYSTVVKSLNLSYNRLGILGLQPVANLLNQNENISRLDLSCNAVGKKSSNQLAGLLSVCHSVECLNLSGNNLGDQELNEIGLSLMEIDSIKEIDLSRNDFGSAIVFGTCLLKCSTLEILNLSQNHLQESASAVFTALRRSNLKILNLSKNGITDTALAPLALGLKKCKSLLDLDISRNFITEKGVNLFANGLKGSSVETLRLANNPLSGKSANTVFTGAGPNMKLLDLSNIRVDLGFLKTLRRKGKDITVLYGSEIRMDFCSVIKPSPPPSVDAVMTADEAVVTLQKQADIKGVSLRNVLKTLHATVFEQKAAAEDAEKDAKNKKDEKKAKKKKKKKAIPQGSVPVSIDEFAVLLAGSPIALSKKIAKDLAVALANQAGHIDMWNLISRIEWRPDDLEIQRKMNIKPPEKDKKGKQKKK